MGADEEKATLIMEIEEEALAALDRLEAKGFPDNRIDSRCDIHYGPEGDHDIWKELMYWEIPIIAEEHVSEQSRTSVKLWSDGDIEVHAGLTVEQLASILTGLRQLGR